MKQKYLNLASDYESLVSVKDSNLAINVEEGWCAKNPRFTWEEF